LRHEELIKLRPNYKTSGAHVFQNIAGEMLHTKSNDAHLAKLFNAFSDR
jgi:hypothetical protein